VIPQHPIGPYQPLRLLGQGGMGSVLLAHDPQGREVAVKVLLLQQRQGSDHLARFDRERRLQATLGIDDGFVPLLDAGQASGRPYVVMPVMTGGSLSDRLRTRGALPIEEATRLVAALAESVGRAHARGVVHRDLKPDNVLFATPHDDRPLIADLGLAKHFRPQEGDARVSLSVSGVMRGTLGYMAPEQIEDAKSAGPQADVYALGVLLFFLICGELPVVADTAIHTLNATVQGELRPLRLVRPDAPAWLERVVARALALDPQDRYADGDALAAALVPPAPRSRPAVPVHPVLLALGLVLCGMLSLLGWLLLDPGGSAPAPAPDEAAAPVDPGPDPPAPVEEPPTAPPSAPPPPADPAPRNPPFPSAEPFLPSSLQPLLTSTPLRLTEAWTSYRGRCGGLVIALALSPDDRAVATCAADGVLRVWDVETGAERWHALLAAWPTDVSYARGEELVMTAAEDGLVRAWDARTGRARGQLAHDQSVQTLIIQDASAQALTLSGGTWRQWDLQLGLVVRELQPLPAGPAVVSPDERWLYLASGAELHRWDLALGQLAGTWTLPRGSPQVVALGPTGRRLLVGSADGWLTLVDVALERAVWVHEAFPPAENRGDGSVRSIVFLDMQHAITTGDDFQARSWFLDGATPALLPLDRIDSWIHGLAVTRSGDLIGGANDGAVHRWTADGRAVWPDAGPLGPVSVLAGLPDGGAVSCSFDGVVRRWGADGRERARVRSPSEPTCVAVEPGGERVALGLENGLVAIWDLEATELDPMIGHVGAVQTLAFVGPDRLVSHADGEPTLVWDLAQGQPAGFLGDRTDWRIPDMAPLPDGGLLLADSRGGALVWTGLDRPPHRLRGDPWSRLVTSRDGGLALAVRAADEAVLWDMRSGTLLQRFPGSRINDLAISPDGRWGAVLRQGAIELLDLEQRTVAKLEPLRMTVEHLTHAAWLGERGVLVGTNLGSLLRFEVTSPE
jgi:serine/threonine protein kinase/WD40 repeat protein